MEAYKDAITAYGWFYPVVEFISMLALAGILTYGGFRIRRGALTLGVVVAFLQYGLRFFRPIQDLSEKYNILQSAMASSERIFKLLDTRARGDRARRRRWTAPRASAADRIRPRLVRLQGRGLGAARRQLHASSRARPSRWWATPARARPR